MRVWPIGRGTGLPNQPGGFDSRCPLFSMRRRLTVGHSALTRRMQVRFLPPQLYFPVARMVERLPVKRMDAGSNPAWGAFTPCSTSGEVAGLSIRPDGFDSRARYLCLHGHPLRERLALQKRRAGFDSRDGLQLRRVRLRVRSLVSQANQAGSTPVRGAFSGCGPTWRGTRFGTGLMQVRILSSRLLWVWRR